MTPTAVDLHDTSLCLWREARGEGVQGMIAVGCIIRNRTRKEGTSYHTEVYKPWQFTSMTDPNDPEYHLEPLMDDTSWKQAQFVATGILQGTIADLTGGATLYWNPNGIKSNKMYTLPNGQQVKFPQTWNIAATHFAAIIGHHIFLTEV